MGVWEALGRVKGGILSPLAALGSLARNARLFHPDGVMYWANVRPLQTDDAWLQLAQQLSGPALVRFSGAWWRKGKEWPDVLGFAIRFIDNEESLAPSARDQDLLFATIKNIATLPISPLFTNVHDYLANDYYAISPFSVGEMGRVKFRMVPMRLRTEPGTREDKLESRVQSGFATLRIEAKREGFSSRWNEIVSVDLTERADLDDATIAFNPFRSGRGIQPVGLIQMMRAAVYPASVMGRTRT